MFPSGTDLGNPLVKLDCVWVKPVHLKGSCGHIPVRGCSGDIPVRGCFGDIPGTESSIPPPTPPFSTMGEVFVSKDEVEISVARTAFQARRVF